jgi:uncharacterized protein
MEGLFTRRHPFVAIAVIAAAAFLAPFAFRVNTDPSLPSYFAEGGDIRVGIEAIDRAGGSSPLDMVVTDAQGRGLDDDEAFERLQALHHSLERHRDVGSVLSIALLMAEAERPWYSFLFSWERRLERLDSPEHDRIGRTFISEDRKRGRFILRMHETARERPRQEIIGEIAGIVRQHGFRPVEMGGLYPLQGELSRLVEQSVRRSLGVLLVLFSLIALFVVRSVRSALAMAAGLALTPFTLFGLVGLFRVPLDIFAAPAANVALALGIDEMIHLGHAARRLRGSRGGWQANWEAWKEALAELWYPIVAAMLIVGAGFALFTLSNFPPTRRLGLLISIGVVIADLVVLMVLPAMVARFRRGR